VNVDDVKALATQIREEVAKAITGQHDTVDLMLTALFAGGHILLEGPPGTAKTMTARCFAQALGVAYGRIQFTPDLMPGDIVGSNIYNFQTGQFTLTHGPIFCDLLLADEINRTPPKTQAALLEAMQEHAVTFDGTTHSLGQNFMVVATQNPIEHQGVYPLPEAQLDRFLFKHRVSYPDAQEEKAIIIHHGGGTASHDIKQYGITAQADRKTLEKALATVGEVTLVDDVVDYIARLVRATRATDPSAPDFVKKYVNFGASVRAAQFLVLAAKARALMKRRYHVTYEDVTTLMRPILRHRILLNFQAESDHLTQDHILGKLLEAMPAPRE